MRVGIYTIHACNNFGAVLQAYATVTYIKRLGYKAEIVDITTQEAEKGFRYLGKWNTIKGFLSNIFSCLNPRIKKKTANFSRFRKKLTLSRRFYNYSEYASNPISYDVHLVGSDQVWNVENGLGDKFYFLPFLSSKECKVSFASSFGNIEAAKSYKEEITNLLSSFTCISVREEDACKFLTDECHIGASNVLDPTFLLSDKDWDNVADQKRLINKPYILYYGFDRGANVGEILKSVKQQTSFLLVGISVTTHSPYKFDLFYQEAGPAEFLSLIKNAHLVITSSFHGMALSLNYRKDFIVIKNGTRMSRMESVLTQFGLTERIVSSKKELNEIITTPIDYSQIESSISAKIAESKEWLLTMLSSL